MEIGVEEGGCRPKVRRRKIGSGMGTDIGVGNFSSSSWGTSSLKSARYSQLGAFHSKRMSG